ncbi:MAG: hypothetical protein AB1896_08410 [Thermodesulfobacteriota bacterium]
MSLRRRLVSPALAITALLLLFRPGPVTAAEFRAEATLMRNGRPQAARLLVKGDRQRLETLDVFGQEQVLISNPGQGLTLLVYPKNKAYMRIPAVAAVSPIGDDEEGLRKIGTRKLLGREMKNGYQCDKYEVVFHNRLRGRMLVWVAEKLDYPILMIQVGGLASGLVRELRDIREEKLDDALFELPPGYELQKKPVQGFCGAGVCTISFY